MDNKLCQLHPKSHRLTTKCCKEKVCWLCHNDTIHTKCSECNITTCGINCKTRTVVKFEDRVYHDEYCPKCYNEGLQNGEITTKKPNDIDIWLSGY